MDTGLENFLLQDEIKKLKGLDLFIALMWMHYKQENKEFISLDQICQELDNVGLNHDNNRSRLKNKLYEREEVQAGKYLCEFKIKKIHVKEYDKKYAHLLDQKNIEESNSYFELGNFKIKGKDYIYPVVKQINASYEYNLYDCCAVMIRRLLETLIIEIYEKENRTNDIKNENNFMMFSELLSHIEKDNQINLGRNTIKGLKSFKKIADSSAHDRFFICRRHDLEKIKQDLVIATNSLRNKAFS